MKTEWADCTAPIVRLPITTLGETEAVLMEDWHVWRVGGMYNLTVPKDATTDGASIPRLFWRICGHPLQAPRVYAAVHHDWLYRNGWKFGITRKEADECYYALLRHFGISLLCAKTEYYALRLFGGRHYVEGEK
jgi:hypothetical protein